jgi:hypothetical protein
MLTAANDAEIVGVFGEVPRELAVGELVIHDDLIHRKRQRLRELLHEVSVLAFIGRPHEIAPQRIGNGAYFFVGIFDDVQAGNALAALSLIAEGSSSAIK